MSLDPLTAPPRLVANAEKVTSVYGGWPRFHDAEVLSLLLDRKGPALVARIMAIHVNRNETDARGDFRLIGRYNVTLRFEGIKDLSIEDFNHQNVLSGVYYEEQDQEMQVTMHGIFGTHVKFRCSAATVEEVVPSE